jgi:hypothetical protein
MLLPLLTLVLTERYSFIIISVIECVSAMSIILCLLLFKEAGQDRVTVTSTLSESHKVERLPVARLFLYLCFILGNKRRCSRKSR